MKSFWISRPGTRNPTAPKGSWKAAELDETCAKRPQTLPSRLRVRGNPETVLM